MATWMKQPFQYTLIGLEQGSAAKPYEIVRTLDPRSGRKWVSCNCLAYTRGKQNRGLEQWERTCKHIQRGYSVDSPEIDFVEATWVNEPEDGEITVLTEWLRTLMLGPDSDASEETVQQVAAFLQEEEEAEDDVWVPEVLCGEHCWGSDVYVYIEEDPYTLRMSLMADLLGSWLFAETTEVDLDTAAALVDSADDGAVVYDGPHTEFVQVQYQDHWVLLAANWEDQHAVYRTLPSNEPLPKELHG